MHTSSRLYHCGRCHAQVIICSNCDHGQRYCAGGCHEIARAESLRRAAKKYQATWAGRVNNAARQKRFRARKKQIVTHQGSLQNRAHGLLKTHLIQPGKAKNPVLFTTTLCCHHCGAVCEPLLRHDFLHSSRFKRTFRRHPRFNLSDNKSETS